MSFEARNKLIKQFICRANRALIPCIHNQVFTEISMYVLRFLLQYLKCCFT